MGKKTRLRTRAKIGMGAETAKADLSKIKITRHALARFQERWPKYQKDFIPKDYRKTLENLLLDVREIKKKSDAAVRAIIKYNFEKARYFENCGWVFITDEGMATLFTVEWRKDREKIWVLHPEGERKRYKI